MVSGLFILDLGYSATHCDAMFSILHNGPLGHHVPNIFPKIGFRLLFKLYKDLLQRCVQKATKQFKTICRVNKKTNNLGKLFSVKISSYFSGYHYRQVRQDSSGVPGE